MTLLEVAKWITDNNSVGLTGSMMFKLRGIDLEREPHDLDFIGFEGTQDKIDKIKVPKGFLYRSQDGKGSAVESVVFYNKELDIKLDFMYSEEDIDFDLDIPLGDLQECIQKKIGYAVNDKSEESRTKHLSDLQKLEPYMNIESFQRFTSIYDNLDNLEPVDYPY